MAAVVMTGDKAKQISCVVKEFKGSEFIEVKRGEYVQLSGGYLKMESLFENDVGGDSMLGEVVKFCLSRVKEEEKQDLIRKIKSTVMQVAEIVDKAIEEDSGDFV